MKGINRIMVCVDLSEYSKMTIEYAVAFTSGSSIELLFFNVVNERDVQAVQTANRFYPELINVERYIEEAVADRHKQLYELINKCCPSDRIKMKILVRVGQPYDEILKAIESEKVDLVMMGNKGRTNLERTLFGSNAEKVFRHSPVPVLSIRDPKRFDRS